MAEIDRRDSKQCLWTPLQKPDITAICAPEKASYGAMDGRVNCLRGYYDLRGFCYTPPPRNLDPGPGRARERHHERFQQLSP